MTNIIDKLRQTSPEERVTMMEKIYKKNITFLEKYYPEVNQCLNNQECPYHIDLTETFLNIVHSPTGEMAHPETGLDFFAETLGDWVHDAWGDLLNLKIVAPPENTQHHKVLKELYDTLDASLPDYRLRYASRRLNLKTVTENRRFSPPVIFLGIFHGLHIDYYLQRTDVASVMLIEPEPERFEVSCYFLDYEQLQERFGKLLFIVDDTPDLSNLHEFFPVTSVTPHMWSRILPAYAGQSMPTIIQQLQSLQLSLSKMTFDIDQELRGFANGYEKLKQNALILSQQVSLSKSSRVAIIASGPSLNKDISWLRDNQDNLIIIAVHSAVLALTNQGVKPDFQVSFETELDESVVKSLQMQNDVPLISYYKIDSVFEKYVDEVLYFAEDTLANVADFKFPLKNALPSSTSLAFSLSMWCKASEIYLIGCDFGYRDTANTHAEGTFHKGYNQENVGTKEEKKTIDESAVIVDTNFNDGTTFYSPSFLTHTRLSLEKSIEENRQGTKVYNLSDGAAVKGAIPAHSTELSLQDYKKKDFDVELLRAVFQPAVAGENYKLFQETLESQFNRFCKECLTTIEAEQFSWIDFTKSIDSAVEKALEKCQNQENDLQARLFSRLMVDLLSVWYMYIIFYDSSADVEKVHTLGRKKIRVLLDEFSLTCSSQIQ